MVSLALTVAAVVWPATVPSATVSLYSLVVVYAAAARLFEQRALAYVASALLFAPFALTIHWLEVDSTGGRCYSLHWRLRTWRRRRLTRHGTVSAGCQ